MRGDWHGNLEIVQIRKLHVVIDSVLALHFHLSEIFKRGAASPLHLFVTYPHPKLTMERLPYYVARKGRSITLDKVGDKIYEIKLRIRKRGARGWLVIKKEVWLFYIRSEETSSVGSVAEDWISGMIPFISHARIPPSKLFDILDSLNEVCNGQLIIQDYLAHSYTLGKRLRHEGQKDWASQKGWTGELYKRGKLERKLSASETVLHAANVDFPNEKSAFLARISKNGHLTFYRGSEQGFSNFSRLVADVYMQKAFEYRTTLDKKEAEVKKKEENVIHPIVFTPKPPKMSLGISDFSKMVEAVTAEANYMVSVIHKGNPWLYLTIVDRADGSACEFYGFDDRLEIIPQLKATPESLARLEDLVYEVFSNVAKSDGQGARR